MRWLAFVSRIVVAGTFLWAAATKFPDLSTFATEIANYQVVPAIAVPWLSAALPGIELLAGVLCLIGWKTRAATAILTGLLIVFIVALSQALVRGINLQCGCFGGADMATWGTVWRDLGLLIPSGIVLWRGPGSWAMERPLAE